MKGFRVLCLIFCICLPLFSYDLDAPVSLPIKESEPNGLDPDKLIQLKEVMSPFLGISAELNLDILIQVKDGYADIPYRILQHRDIPYEILQYGEGVLKKQKIFFNTLKTAITPESKDIFLGRWVLQDEAGNSVSPYRLTEWSKWGQGEAFDIIEMYGELKYGNSSPVYYSKQGEFYILHQSYEILKQLKVVNGRLYVYVLINDEWVMDPMHAYGKYSYVKHPPRN